MKRGDIIEKSKLGATATVLTVGAVILTGACVARSKFIHARNMRRALATAKAQTSSKVVGSFLDHTPIVSDDGTLEYNGGVIVMRNREREVLPFTYIESTNQIKRTIA
ncbi:hypothetical protein [Lacticaseibacillus sharpeae]|uniref:Uncharacterized protein n=1 Tax=Lacticaseibacillus sharpeae JCM 1186 = DSM 20505 TaxID=1291052 RepID=A0A0R1ZPV6_9LACO|nr:hypothetical protein [Lacticaseibacillus sharpeae]KRM56591.1 hypothetical protein FC18_GL002075 [Lacticaseibacillus sharpeae JCM 1186 = DSM 20505]